VSFGFVAVESRCFGPLFTAPSTARSKRSQASGRVSISLDFLVVGAMAKAPKRFLNKKYPRIFYRIGAISLQWNTADYYLEQLIKAYMMFEDEWADIFLDTWGNETRGTVLNKMIPASETDPAFIEYALHISKFFAICRENRNFVVHGVVRQINKDGFIIERFTRRQESRADFLITMDILEEIESEIIVLCGHLRFLIHNNSKWIAVAGKRAPLPEKPPLPRKGPRRNNRIERKESGGG
jgi:hypothetical protein